MAFITYCVAISLSEKVTPEVGPEHLAEESDLM